VQGKKSLRNLGEKVQFSKNPRRRRTGERTGEINRRGGKNTKTWRKIPENLTSMISRGGSGRVNTMERSGDYRGRKGETMRGKF